MNQTRKNAFAENLIDQVCEAQMKLGYANESMRFYYTLQSLGNVLDMPEAEIKKRLKDNEPEEWLVDTELGCVLVTRKKERVEVQISSQGVENVWKHHPASEFLKELISLFSKEVHEIEPICDLFCRFDSKARVDKMREETDFDYVCYFPDGKPDSYYYCIKNEMDHMIYHRFTKADFANLMQNENTVR